MSRQKPWRNQPPTTITMAGVPVRRDMVQWLARESDQPASGRLQRALVYETRLLALEIDEREAILRALESCPDELTELRAVLLQEHVGRVRDGLA